MAFLSSTLHYLLSVLLWGGLTVSVIIYIGRSSRAFLYIGLYLLTCVLIEETVFAMEHASSIFSYLAYVLSSVHVVRGVLYGANAVFMMGALCYVLECPITLRRMIPVIPLCLWLLIVPLIRETSVLGSWIFLLPVQIYIFVLSLLGLRRLGQLPFQAHHSMLRRMFRLTAVLAVLILAEDTVRCWQVDVSMRQNGLTMDQVLSTTDPRNYCETILQVLLAGHALYAGGHILTDTLNTEKKSGVVIPEPVELKPTAAELFGETFGLSPREQEMLPLLLENKSFGQIAEELYISQGTVKTHAHNIYQKTGVKDRAELMRTAAEIFKNIQEDETCP